MVSCDFHLLRSALRRCKEYDHVEELKGEAELGVGSWGVVLGSGLGVGCFLYVFGGNKENQVFFLK